MSNGNFTIGTSTEIRYDVDMKFKSIGIIGKQHIEGVTESVTTLINFLHAKKINIFLESNTAKLLPKKQDFVVINYEEIADKCNLLIVVGGDGCMLNAAHVAALQNVLLKF